MTAINVNKMFMSWLFEEMPGLYQPQSNVHTILKASCNRIINFVFVLIELQFEVVKVSNDCVKMNGQFESKLEQLGLGFLIHNYFPFSNKIYRFFQISTATVGNQGVRLSKNRRDSEASRDDLQFQRFNRSLLQKEN